MIKNICAAVSAVSLIGVLILTFVIIRQPKSVFFYNEKVFAAFNGKIELENKLKIEQGRNKASLDSLSSLIVSGRTDLKVLYDHTAELASMREEQLTQKYTADIWKFINDSAADYGKENNYEFIFGALGNGTLMYASDKNDVTDEFIKYLNAEYTGAK